MPPDSTPTDAARPIGEVRPPGGPAGPAADGASAAAPATLAAAAPGAAGFSAFLQLERSARHAETVQALDFIVANETRRLVAYRQAAVLEPRPGRRWRLTAVSGVSTLDRDAAYVRWLERVAAALGTGAETAAGARPRPVTAADLPPALARDWGDWAAPQVLWMPLVAPDGTSVGVLWLARDKPFDAAETVLLERLADAFAHARRALIGRRRRPGSRRRWGRVATLILAASALAAMAVPVRQSALAPAEVVAADPLVVTAPIDGVVAAMAVAPNQRVEAGDLLVRFDDTEVRSARDVAERTLGVAEAEWRRATQGAFADARSAAQIAVLEARRDLRAAELAYAEARLARVEIRAPRAGVAIYADPDDWVGRPVATGERILTLADPDAARLRIDLAVADAIELESGAPVDLFLDAAPLRPVEARVGSAAYEAEPTPAGVLAYRVEADFVPAATVPRIGLRGTAKIHGDRVPLGYYLFRRPIAWVRQATGL